MGKKIFVFDLFDTLLLKKDFDYFKGAEFLIDKIFKQRVSMEEFKIISDSYRNKYMINRHVTHIEVNFIHQLNYFKQKFLFRDNRLSLYEIESIFMDICRKEICFTSTERFLKFIHENSIPIYVASNSIFSSQTLTSYLTKFSIGKYVSKIYSSADIGYRKPSSVFFNYVKEDINNSMGKNNGIFYYIGNDFFKDIVGGYQSNFKVIWYNRAKERIDKKQYEKIKYKEISDMNELRQMVN